MSLLATATGSYDLALVLGNLLLILISAKLMGELAQRLRIPAVLGEIVAGIIIGPSVLGWIEPLAHANVADMIVLLGEIGVILLLLQVGLEMDVAELGRVGRSAMSVAVIGVAVPFAGGIAVASGFGESGEIAVFIGAALTATSVGITARVLGDLRALSMTESRIVLGAAVADDILGLVILTVVVKVVAGGTVEFSTVLGTIGLALGFLLVTGLLAIFVVPKTLNNIHRFAQSETTVVIAALGLTFGFALLADVSKLAFIIGAFMAGLGIGRSTQQERIASGLNPLGQVFIPVFFASIGINTDISAMLKPHVLALAGALTFVAIIGKLFSALGAFGTKTDRLLIGIGMIPRGEVGLIFASIGLAKGVLDDDLYAAVVLMVLVTTLITPPLLTWRLRANTARSILKQNEPVTLAPIGGWITSANDQINIHGNPPASLYVSLAFRSAKLATYAQPTDELLQWFSDHRRTEIIWQPTDTAQLLDLLRDASPASWHFLELTGVLEKTLPEVAETVDARRREPTDVDPLHPLRFPTVNRLHNLMQSPGIDPLFDQAHQELRQPELVTLGSFLLDTTTHARQRHALAQRLQTDSASTVSAALSLASDLVSAARGPRFDPPPAYADPMTNQQLLHLAYVMAVLTHENDTLRAPLDNMYRMTLIGDGL